MRVAGTREPVNLHNVNVEGSATYKSKSFYKRIRHTDEMIDEEIELIGVR